MKISLAFFTSIFLSLASWGQDTVYVTITEWAGGVCCTYGTEYTISFQTNRIDWQIDSMELNLNGLAYPLRFNNTMQRSNGNFIIRFSSRTQDSGYDVEQVNTIYSGIDPTKIHPLEIPYELFRIYYTNGKIRNAPLVITKAYLAYP